MYRQWEARTCLKDGFVKIAFGNGEEITVTNDGRTGYEFVEEYLADMGVNYPTHLIAADMKLQQRLGKSYKAIRANERRYKAELALVSLNCCFGKEDERPDNESDGTKHPEFILCPERYNCLFNGYNPAFKEKKLVCCNPIYECGLTPTQARVADMIVNTSLSYESIAEALGCSLNNIECIRKRIFAQLGVASRPELTQLLREKRLV